MNPEESRMLRETFELARKNNDILTKLHRASVWGRAVKTIYWVLLLGITIGAFYFLQPYVDQLQSLYGQVLETKNQFGDFFGGQ